MTTITFRVSEQERADLVSAASRSGLTLSEYVRRALAVREADTSERLADVERRLATLEEMASRAG